MPHHLALKLMICGAGFAAIGGPAVAQDSQWNEGPGDIVITRNVPRQNAVLVGEPGQPTLVNPRAAIAASNAFTVGAGAFTQPLDDLEAEAVRATRNPGVEALDEALGARRSEISGETASTGGSGLGHERTGFVGGAVSGAMAGAGRQIQGVLSSALGRGRL